MNSQEKSHKKPVKIRIKDTQGEIQTIRGAYYQRGEDRYVMYREKPEGFDAEIKSRIKYREGYLELTRQCNRTVQIICEVGKNHSVSYPTPYGQIDFETRTKRVDLSQIDGKERVLVEYEQFQEDQKIQDIRLDILISPM